jgi:phage baseplate assembly protein W
MMDEGRVFGRGMGFPPRVGADGRVAWSSGPANIRESIRVLLLTNAGERLHRPEYGSDLRPLLFEPNTVTTRRQVQSRITRALEAWEPRIALEAVDVESDPEDDRAAIATIAYRLVATQAVESLSLRLPLAG